MPPPSAQAASGSLVIGRSAVRIRIVAHASPRWRGAHSAEEADRHNLDLSKRRADAVAREISSIVEELRGPFSPISTRDVSGTSRLPGVDISAEVMPGATSMMNDHRGSYETLWEAGGERTRDDPQFRRVDVIIEWESGRKVQAREPLMRSTLTRNWALSLDVSSAVSVGGTVAYLNIRLYNTLAKQSMEGQVLAAGGGPKAKLGASKAIWNDPTPFTTEDPVTFEDFDGNWIGYYTPFEVSAFLGYSVSDFSFSGMGDGAKHIDTGGWSIGAQGGVGGLTAVTGRLSLVGTYPPTEIPVPGSAKLVTRHARTVSGGNMCKLHFETGNASLAPVERVLLAEFLEAALPQL